MNKQTMEQHCQSRKNVGAHWWKMPVVGDVGLVCESCGRVMDFMGEMTPNLRASVTNGVENRRGYEAAQTFREALYAAFEAARESWRSDRGYH